MTSVTADLALESTVAAARDTYRFHTADGVCSPDAFRAPDRLLLNTLWEVDPGRLLVQQANYGVVGVVLAEQATSVLMVESSARAARLCQRNSAENGIDTTTTLTADVTNLAAAFDTAAYAPKPYTPISIGKQRIANTLSRLRPGGRFYLAAATQTGLARYERCLSDLATACQRIRRHGDHALLEAVAANPVDPPTYVTPRTVRESVNGVTLTLQTLPGRFSPTKLDGGTRFLLETTPIKDTNRMLDMCCGTGAIGVYADRQADCNVWLSDDDCLATRCAEASLDASNADGTVVTGDCVEGVEDQTFDTVFCNPPTHAGAGVLTDLFTGIHGVLRPAGDLHLVHHWTLDLGPHLTRFGSVEPRRTSDEYVVVQATR